MEVASAVADKHCNIHQGTDLAKAPAQFCPLLLQCLFKIKHVLPTAALLLYPWQLLSFPRSTNGLSSAAAAVAFDRGQV